MKIEKNNKYFIILFFVLFALPACQSLKTRKEVKVGQIKTKSGREILVPIKEGGPKEIEQTGPEVSQAEAPKEGEPEVKPVETQEEVTPPVTVQKAQTQKIGIILGGGGALTYGHLAFLKSLQDQKVTLHSIAGIELAAPIAALYSLHQNSNEVEWQMYKLKDEDLMKKNLFNQVEKYNSQKILQSFIHDSLGNKTLNSGDIPFYCAKFFVNLAKVQLQGHGSFDKVLPGCTAYPSFFGVNEGEVAAIREVYSISREMKKAGADHIIFVNVLSQRLANPQKKDDLDSLLWKEVQFEYSRVQNYVDEVINLDVGGYGVWSFDKRREIQYKAYESLNSKIPDLARKWGF